MNRISVLLVLLFCASYAVAEPLSDRRGILCREGMSFIGPKEPQGSVCPQGEDTIYYDDGYGFWYSTVGSEWGVRFSTYIPCTLNSILTMTFGFEDECSLFVREDSSGRPGPIVREMTYVGGAYPEPGWDRVDLISPYYDMNSFWITGWYPTPPYIVADSSNDAGRSCYTFDGQTWLSYSSGDLMIRTIVAYGETLTHDISVVNIGGIPRGVVADSEYTDTLYLRNFGTQFESPSIQFEVRDSAGLVEFDTLLQVDSLPPQGSGFHTSTWTPGSHGETYVVSAAVLLPGDLNPENDTFQMTVQSYMDGEIYYDDFTSERWLNVDRDENDKFAVMYELGVTPSYITGARFFVNDTASFDCLSLCPDMGGIPDTGNPYVEIPDLRGQMPGSWVWSSFDTSLSRVDADTVWLVLTWPDSRSGPYVGSDRDLPVDGKSWAFSDSTGWVNWTESDFMMRIVSLPATGVEEEERANPLNPLAGSRLRLLPNPFVHGTRLALLRSSPVEIGEVERASLRAFDLAGRCVKEFDARDVQTLLGGLSFCWDGAGSGGECLPPAVYFIVLRFGGSTVMAKAVLVL